jgi:CheY-like chemotaxis protein
VLLFEDSLDEISLWVEWAELHELYDFRVAATANVALDLLGSQSFHVCLYDLGIQDSNGDELGVLREYRRRHVACILQTAMDKGAISFEAARLGAVEFLRKPYRFEDAARLINKWFLRRILCCGADSGVKDRWMSICEVLLTQHPDSTYSWARAAGITPNRLKQISHECLNTEARHVFWLARSYDCVFAALGLHWDPQWHVSENSLLSLAARVSTYWTRHDGALQRTIAPDKALVSAAS